MKKILRKIFKKTKSKADTLQIIINKRSKKGVETRLPIFLKFLLWLWKDNYDS